MTDEFDFVEDFDISSIEQSTFPVGRALIQKSGLIAKIGPTSFTIYQVLRSFVNPVTGVAWPGNEAIGEIIDRKHDTVSRAIEDLVNVRLIYVATPPGGPKTRGIRLIDWLPAHVHTGTTGSVVKGKVAIPFIPQRFNELMLVAKEAAMSPAPELALRVLSQKYGNADIEGWDFIKFPLDGEWVFAICPGDEKITRPFFMAAGVPFDDVVGFYEKKRSFDSEDKLKMRAAALSQREADGYEGF